MICQTNESMEREQKSLQTMLDNRIDGLLISISKGTTSFEHLHSLMNTEMPVVFFDRVCDEIPSHRVITDDFEGARIATKHLIDIGCRRIVHLTGAPSLVISKQRLDGYKTALMEAGIAVDESLIIEADSDFLFNRAEDKLITIAPEIDGVFAINDSTAIAAMKLFQMNGYSIPDDIAVIGFGDGPVNDIVSPTLSSVVQSGYEIGCEAMNMLIKQIDSDIITLDYETRVFTPTLKVRESTKRLK